MAVFFSAATAAEGDTDLGSRGGITYIKDIDSPSPPDLSVIEAGCPAETEVASGVADPGTSVAASDLNDVAPADGGDGDSDLDDAWFTSVSFPAPPSPLFPNPRVFAICEARSHHQPTASTTVPAGEARSVSVLCPGGTGPTGGGATLGGDEEDGAFVNSSYPLDGPDANKTPDDGWRARAYNPAGMTKTLGVAAVCRRGELRYKRRSERARAGRLATPSTGCKVRGREHLVGAGWRWSGPASEAEFGYGSLEDSYDGDDVPDDYAGIGGTNTAGDRKKMTGHAICTR